MVYTKSYDNMALNGKYNYSSENDVTLMNTSLEILHKRRLIYKSFVFPK